MGITWSNGKDLFFLRENKGVKSRLRLHLLLLVKVGEVSFVAVRLMFELPLTVAKIVGIDFLDLLKLTFRPP